MIIYDKRFLLNKITFFTDTSMNHVRCVAYCIHNTTKTKESTIQINDN